jgi:hypothetical protein
MRWGRFLAFLVIECAAIGLAIAAPTTTRTVAWCVVASIAAIGVFDLRATRVRR